MRATVWKPQLAVLLLGYLAGAGCRSGEPVAPTLNTTILPEVDRAAQLPGDRRVRPPGRLNFTVTS